VENLVIFECEYHTGWKYEVKTLNHPVTGIGSEWGYESGCLRIENLIIIQGTINAEAILEGVCIAWGLVTPVIRGLKILGF
jgi:hypothetical protein